MPDPPFLISERHLFPIHAPSYTPNFCQECNSCTISPPRIKNIVCAHLLVRTPQHSRAPQTVFCTNHDGILRTYEYLLNTCCVLGMALDQGSANFLRKKVVRISPEWLWSAVWGCEWSLREVWSFGSSWGMSVIGLKGAGSSWRMLNRSVRIPQPRTAKRIGKSRGREAVKKEQCRCLHWPWCASGERWYQASYRRLIRGVGMCVRKYIFDLKCPPKVWGVQEMGFGKLIRTWGL